MEAWRAESLRQTAVRFRRAGVVVAALVVIAACSSGDTSDPASFEEGELGPLVVFPGPSDPDSGEQAAIGGVVGWSGAEDDCIHDELASEGQEVAYGIVWPLGTTWDAETSEVVLSSGRRLGVGDAFRFSGGDYSVELPDGAVDFLPSELRSRIEACGWQDYMIIQGR